MPAGLLLLALAAAPAGAAAAEWRVAATSAGSVAFVDAAGVERSGDTVTFRLDTRLREPLSHGRSLLSERVEAGCASRSWKSKSSFRYREKGRDLTATDTITTTAKAGTVYAGVIDAACTGKYVTGAIADPARWAAAYFAATGTWRERLDAAARSQGDGAAPARP